MEKNDLSLDLCVYKFFKVDKFISGKGTFICKECNGEDKLYCPHYLSLRKAYRGKTFDEIKDILKNVYEN